MWKHYKSHKYTPQNPLVVKIMYPNLCKTRHYSGNPFISTLKWKECPQWISRPNSLSVICCINYPPYTRLPICLQLWYLSSVLISWLVSVFCPCHNEQILWRFKLECFLVVGYRADILWILPNTTIMSKIQISYINRWLKKE